MPQQQGNKDACGCGAGTVLRVVDERKSEATKWQKEYGHGLFAGQCQ